VVNESSIIPALYYAVLYYAVLYSISLGNARHPQALLLLYIGGMATAEQWALVGSDGCPSLSTAEQGTRLGTRRALRFPRTLVEFHSATAQAASHDMYNARRWSRTRSVRGVLYSCKFNAVRSLCQYRPPRARLCSKIVERANHSIADTTRWATRHRHQPISIRSFHMDPTGPSHSRPLLMRRSTTFIMYYWDLCRTAHYHLCQPPSLPPFSQPSSQRRSTQRGVSLDESQSPYLQ